MGFIKNLPKIWINKVLIFRFEEDQLEEEVLSEEDESLDTRSKELNSSRESASSPEKPEEIYHLEPIKRRIETTFDIESPILKKRIRHPY